MNATTMELLGYAAAALTTTSFVPQAIHTVANAVTVVLAATILTLAVRSRRASRGHSARVDRRLAPVAG